MKRKVCKELKIRIKTNSNLSSLTICRDKKIFFHKYKKKKIPKARTNLNKITK